MPGNSDWILDTLNFTLVGAGYFCIPINLLELCSGTQLSYWKQFNPLRTCFLDILGGRRVVLNLWLISPHYWDKTLMCPSVPHGSWDFSSLACKESIPAAMWTPSTQLRTSNPFRLFFPWPRDCPPSDVLISHQLSPFLSRLLFCELCPAWSPFTLHSVSSTQRDL